MHPFPGKLHTCANKCQSMQHTTRGASLISDNRKKLRRCVFLMRMPTSASTQEHFARLVPEADVDARCAMLAGSPDYVIDAIDNIDTKVALLVACRKRGIPVLCVAGAGAPGSSFTIFKKLPAAHKLPRSNS